MAEIRKKKIGEVLLAEGLIDEDQLSFALEEYERIRGKLPLGKVMVKLGFIDDDTLLNYLGTQVSIQSGKRLGEILVDLKYVTAEQVDKAIGLQKSTGKKLGRCLIDLGALTEDKLLAVLSVHLDAPKLNLENSHLFESSAVSLVPESMARELKIIPVYVKNGTLTVAMVDPSDFRAIDHLKFKTNLDIEVMMATEAEIKRKQDALYGSVQESLSSLIGDSGADLETVDNSQNENEVELSDEEGRQVVKLVNTLINEAVSIGASDIHLEPQETHLQLRYRIDGELRMQSSIPGKLMGQVLSRLKILAKMDISEKRRPLDGRFTIRNKGKEVDLRVSSFPITLRKRGVVEKIVMRILDPEGGQLALDDMGMSPESLAKLKAAINLPNGIILVTGPTGSGKSTTLYSCIRHVNSPAVNISTMEDPVELNLDGVNQGQINAKAGFTFAAGIRALLRQDPDIMLIGEMRDQETASMAIESALTGHLVFSTLHTNDAPGSFPRLLDMGIEPILITSAVKGVLAQRLVRRICKKCKIEVEVIDAVKEKLRIPLDTKFYRGKGCDACDHKGLKGRAAIHEFLVPTEPFRAGVLRHASADELKRIAIDDCKMITLRASGLMLAAKGVITLEEALAASSNDYDEED